MAVELRWVASRAASCFYATGVLARGVMPVQPEAFIAFREPAAELSQAIAALSVPSEPFFDRLVALSPGFDDDRLLAEVVLSKVCRDRSAAAGAERLARLFGVLKRAQATSQPKLLDELELRAGPLREQWEARGPGLLAGMRRLTDADILVERADVLVVYPMRGGGGMAHLAQNAVSIEAVLTNPLPQVPEIVRLAWLIGQLNLDLPRYAETLRNPSNITALAMIPPTLAAAQDVELARDDPTTLLLALESWLPAVQQHKAVADCLEIWWRTWLQNRMHWPAALVALEQMLSDGQTTGSATVESAEGPASDPGVEP